MRRWPLLAPLVATLLCAARPCEACSPRPEYYDYDLFFPRFETPAAVDTALILARHSTDEEHAARGDPSFFLRHRGGKETEIRSAGFDGPFLHHGEHLEAYTTYELVVRSDDGLRVTERIFPFRTGAHTTVLPRIESLMFEPTSYFREGSEGGICEIATEDATLIRAEYRVTFTSSRAVGYGIELGFGPSATDARFASFPERGIPAASVLLKGRAGEPLVGRVELGPVDWWRGAEICAAARLFRYDPLEGGLHHPDGPFVEVQTEVVCKPTPVPVAGPSDRPPPSQASGDGSSISGGSPESRGGGCSTQGTLRLEALFVALPLVFVLRRRAVRRHATARARAR